MRSRSTSVGPLSSCVVREAGFVIPVEVPFIVRCGETERDSLVLSGTGSRFTTRVVSVEDKGLDSIQFTASGWPEVA